MRALLASVSTLCLSAGLASGALPSAAADGSAPGTAEARTKVVVILADDVHLTDVLGTVGARRVVRAFTHAMTGFTAEVTAAQARRLGGDSRVLWVGEDRVVARKQGFEIGDLPTQLVDTSMSRVGLLESPTAAVDGVDGGGIDADIAIVDGGVDRTHPDLRVVGGVNCTQDTDEYSDADGHGTLAAGMAAAKDNDFGVVGTAPGARIWSVKSFDDSGYMTLDQFMCALDWLAANTKRIDVASMSFILDGTVDGACGYVRKPFFLGLLTRKVLVDPYHRAICRIVKGGTAIAAAAGNDATDVSGSLPAAYPETIAVSGLADLDGLPGGLSTDDSCFEGQIDDSLASFSNYGPDVDIAAPAICLITTFPGGGYQLWDGTSFATPMVAGAAALVVAREPAADAARMRAVILERGERSALIGDPDGVAEPILNLRGY